MTKAEKLNRRLIKAAEKGKAKRIKRLIKRGADVNSRRNCSVTALLVAFMYGPAGTAKILAEGMTAIDLARIYRKNDVVELLMAHGAE